MAELLLTDTEQPPRERVASLVQQGYGVAAGTGEVGVDYTVSTQPSANRVPERAIPPIDRGKHHSYFA